MANVYAIHSVGTSIADYLAKTYPKELSDAHPCQFRVISSFELSKSEDFASTTTLTLFLYRVTINEQLRNTAKPATALTWDIPLSLDLHFMATVWANDFLTEHLITAWTMRQLYTRPTLSAADLSPEAEWGPGEIVQLVPEEISLHDLMRIWDAFEPKYRLSYTYVARVVRLDAEFPRSVGQPVVAKRLDLRDPPDPRAKVKP